MNPNKWKNLFITLFPNREDWFYEFLENYSKISTDFESKIFNTQSILPISIKIFSELSFKEGQIKIMNGFEYNRDNNISNILGENKSYKHFSKKIKMGITRDQMNDLTFIGYSNEMLDYEISKYIISELQEKLNVSEIIYLTIPLFKTEISCNLYLISLDYYTKLLNN